MSFLGDRTGTGIEVKSGGHLTLAYLLKRVVPKDGNWARSSVSEGL